MVFILLLLIHTLHNSELESNLHVLPSKRKFPSTNEVYLWHLRLGHFKPNRIQKLVKDGILSSLELDEFLVCESCLKGKIVTP